MTQSFSTINIVILFKHHVYTWSSGLKLCHCKKRRVNVFWFTCEFWCLGAQHWKDSEALKKIQPFSHKLGRKKNGLPSTYGCMIRPLNMAVLLLSTSSAQLVPASPTLSCMTDLPSKQKNLFIYLFILFLAVLGLRCCVQPFSSCIKWGYSLQCTGFSLQWLPLFPSMGSRHTGLSSCCTSTQ